MPTMTDVGGEQEHANGPVLPMTIGGDDAAEAAWWRHLAWHVNDGARVGLRGGDGRRRPRPRRSVVADRNGVVAEGDEAEAGR